MSVTAITMALRMSDRLRMNINLNEIFPCLFNLLRQKTSRELDSLLMISIKILCTKKARYKVMSFAISGDTNRIFVNLRASKYHKLLLSCEQ